MSALSRPWDPQLRSLFFINTYTYAAHPNSLAPVLHELAAGSCHANPKSWGPAAQSQATVSIFLIAPDCPPKASESLSSISSQRHET